MDIKKFAPGFTEQEFNDFQSKHIVFKFQVNTDGGIYVFYKTLDKIGGSTMERIETLDRLTKQAQDEHFAASLDLEGASITLPKLEEELKNTETNRPEWDQLDAKVRETKRQIKMHEATMEVRVSQISVFIEKAEELAKQL